MGYEDGTINLNKLLIKHPISTVFMEINSTKYKNMGIFNGDLLIVDRGKTVKPNSLVVYDKDGEFHLGRACSISGTATIDGVIVHVIHTVREI